MKTIFKYSVPVDDCVHKIKLHTNAQITHVECQHSIDSVEFWALQDTSLPEVEMAYKVVGTGHQLGKDDWVVGTTLPVPTLVWHLVLVGSPDE